MVLAPLEVADLEGKVLELERRTGSTSVDLHYLDDYFVNQPHILLCCGFDEIRIAPRPTPSEFYASLSKLAVKDQMKAPRTPEEIPLRALLRFRYEISGAWYRLSGVMGSQESRGGVHCSMLLMSDSGATVTLRLQDILRFCKATVDPRPRAVVLPPLWREPAKAPGDIPLVTVTRSIVKSAHQHGLDWSTITPRQLEEMVAELLRASGMSVSLTPYTHDGGRDIIARGELIPGEPGYLAVEVKHKAQVGVGDLRQALHANRRFPALLIATSGTFTAGVIREKRDPDWHLRLYLKDGVALREWIDAYARHYLV